MRATILMAAVMVGGAVSAAGTDRHAAAAIGAGDLTRAEAILTEERAGRYTAPETLLNLAHVYRQTDRAEAARTLYQQVLAGGNVLLNAGAERPLWSHDIARAGLAKVGAPNAIAAR